MFFLMVINVMGKIDIYQMFVDNDELFLQIEFVKVVL